MIDPYKYCPRCDVRYFHNGDDIYKCSNYTCKFEQNRYPTESDTTYRLDIYNGEVHYIVLWERNQRTRIYIHEWDGTFQHTSNVVMNFWIPFDITLEQLKVYMTFS